MDTIVETLVVAGFSLAIGVMLGAAMVWSVMARRVDTRARDLSKAAFEGSRRAEALTEEDLRAAGSMTRVRPVRRLDD